MLCNGPLALSPTKELRRAEETVNELQAHVSLADCFELYRLAVRVRLHHPDRMRFLPFSVPFRPPRKPPETFRTPLPQHDPFTEELRAFERTLLALSETVC